MAGRGAEEVAGWWLRALLVTMTKDMAWAEMSGKARPEALNLVEAGSLGEPDERYVATAARCHAGCAHRLEKPPEEMAAAPSGGARPPPCVPPTAVTYLAGAGRVSVREVCARDGGGVQE